MEAREILIYLSLKYKGKWEDIYSAITKKEKISEKDVHNSLNSIKSKCITIIDQNYPDYLKGIYKPPFVIYYYGNIDLIKDYKKNISCIGSRNCSIYGQKITNEIVSKLSQKYNIVSGLALGIDAVAHKAAIKSKGKTIAVLGSGIDYPYPKQNCDLYDEIKKNHLLISEYPGDQVPEKENFVVRNRIVAALCGTLLVSEAYSHSGTLTTVSYALTLGKEVCCIPYPANVNSACNALIKDGARLVEDAKDIDEDCIF